MNPSRKSTRKLSVPPPGGRPGTSRVERSGSPPPLPPKRPNPALFIGGGIGALVLLIGLVAAMSSGTAPKKPVAKKPAPTPVKARPVDVSGLVREGEQKCAEGHRIILDCQAELEEYRRSGQGAAALREKLERGANLIKEGSTCIDEANQKSNGEQGFLDKKYVEAKKLARSMLGELN